MKRKVFITGGSKGIGEATVRYFCIKKNYDVTFTYHKNEKKAHNIVEELTSENYSISTFHLDLNNAKEVNSLIQNLIEKNDGFDIIIHNAAHTLDTPLFFMEENEWNDVIQASLNSFFYINKACIKKMIANRYGRIISIASISGESGNRGQTNYSAAKGALIAASKALAREIGIKGVTVNCVSPGIISTEMTANLPEAELKKMIPIGRFGTPEEVVSAIAFLASEEASYITGEVLRVNGGLYT